MVSSLYMLLLYFAVFMSPETSVKPPWRELFSNTLFQQNGVMVAIDEAHCIYEWLGQCFITLVIQGTCHATLHCTEDLTSIKHSTRLDRLRTFTKVPFMSLTASAYPQIESEIVDSVGLINPVFVKNLINRAIVS